jgi:zeaxanthin epoxidase
MMPNLGQGGCQAMEDAFVLGQELQSATHRSEITGKLDTYRNRRLVRSAAVQGLSRFASDIIIRGFDTPAKIVYDESGIKFENFNYAGIVTKMLQPILPVFFVVQFNFLYDGWKNDFPFDLKAAFGFTIVGGLILLLGAGSVGEAGIIGGFGLESLLGGEGLEAVFANMQDFF